MIAALADAGAALGRQDYIDAARGLRALHPGSRCATPTGGCSAPGRAARPASTPTSRTTPTCVEALLRLYEATLEVRWFDAARETADAMIDRFADDELGGFFTTSNDHEELIARRKDVGDHPIPSGNSSAAYGLLRLAALTGESAYEEWALGTMRALRPRRPAAPRRVRPPAPGDRLPPLPDPRGRAGRAGERRGLDGGLDELARVVRSAHRPHVVLAGGPEGTDRPELLRERTCRRGPAGRLRL